MSVKSAIWVQAHLRRCNALGLPAVLIRRGAEEAGAIFVIIDRLDGTNDLYAPAPQSSFEESHPSDRMFQRVMTGVAADVLSARIGREVRFDPDLWVVAIEDRQGRVFLETIREGDAG